MSEPAITPELVASHGLKPDEYERLLGIVGRVPSYSVVVPGAMPGKPLPDGSPGPSLACAVIVKRVDAQTRSKTAINELLRD